jgi:hypothetical protein
VQGSLHVLSELRRLFESMPNLFDLGVKNTSNNLHCQSLMELIECNCLEVVGLMPTKSLIRKTAFKKQITCLSFAEMLLDDLRQDNVKGNHPGGRI